MRTRRDVIRSLAAGVAVVYPMQVQAAPPKALDQCRRKAVDLAETLSEVAGGDWRVSFDDELEFVLISRVI